MYRVGYWHTGDNRVLAIKLARFYSAKLGYKVFAMYIPDNHYKTEGVLLDV